MKFWRHETPPFRQRRQLCKALKPFGYEITRQTGSHLRLSRAEEPEHHITIPAHDSLRVGALSTILTDVAARLGIDKDEIVHRL